MALLAADASINAALLRYGLFASTVDKRLLRPGGGSIGESRAWKQFIAAEAFIRRGPIMHNAAIQAWKDAYRFKMLQKQANGADMKCAFMLIKAICLFFAEKPRQRF